MSLLTALLFLSLVMAAAWAWQRRVNDIGWVDVFWTFGTAIAGSGLAVAWARHAAWPRLVTVIALIAIWAVRLGLHVAIRVAHAPQEDGRYIELREQWGSSLQPRLFGFLQIQAVVSTGLAAAVALAANRPGPGLGVGDILGVAIALIALGGEALADRQMESFRRNPANAGRICDEGLWALSRHPNYVFEWLGWFAYPAFALDLTGAYPQGWWAFLAPAAMFAVLRYGTGVPPLEAHMLRTRGQAFRDYSARVPVFLPLPPRRSRA